MMLQIYFMTKNIRLNNKNLRRLACLLLVSAMLISLMSIGAAGTPVAWGNVGNAASAPWTLYDNGTVEIGGGIVRSSVTTQSVWAQQGFSNDVIRIVFTEPVEGGASLAGLFGGLPNLVEIENLHYLNTDSTTDMRNVFRGTSGLTNPDVSGFNMTGVTNVLSMFQDSGVVSLDVSGWDMSSVTTMESMFWNANNLTTLDVSNWDVSSVTRMHRTFQGTSSLTALDVSSWDTGSVTVMYHLFAAATSITTLDVSNWDTGNVTNMAHTFRGMTNLEELDVSGWNTSSVTRTDAMFRDSSNLTSLDFSGWNTSSVTTMYNMFSGVSLEILTLGPDWVMPAANFNTRLPAVPTTAPFTGLWQNIGTGTVGNPTGTLTFTSPNLMTGSNGAGETWVWQRSSVTVTFEAGANGTITGGSPQSMTLPAGRTLSEAGISVPGQSGNTNYQFAHWTSNQTAGTFTTDQILNQTIAADTMFTAVFERIPFTVTFAAGANGTLAGGSPQTVTVLSGNTLTSAPAATGDTNYQFAHWTSNQTAGTFTEVEILTHTITADTMFTAVFERISTSGEGNGGGGGPGTGNATIVDNNNNNNSNLNSNNNTGTGSGSGYLGTGSNERPYAGYATEPPAERVFATILLFITGIAVFAYRRVEETKEEENP